MLNNLSLLDFSTPIFLHPAQPLGLHTHVMMGEGGGEGGADADHVVGHHQRQGDRESHVAQRDNAQRVEGRSWNRVACMKQQQCTYTILIDSLKFMLDSITIGHRRNGALSYSSVTYTYIRKNKQTGAVFRMFFMLRVRYD